MKKVLALVVIAGSITLFSCNNSKTEEGNANADSTATPKKDTTVAPKKDTTATMTMDTTKKAAADTSKAAPKTGDKKMEKK